MIGWPVVWPGDSNSDGDVDVDGDKHKNKQSRQKGGEEKKTKNRADKTRKSNK